MKPETRAHIVTEDMLKIYETTAMPNLAYKIALRTILEAHRQSIVECADLALAYGRVFPYARVASREIAKRIRENLTSYPLP